VPTAAASRRSGRALSVSSCLYPPSRLTVLPIHLRDRAHALAQRHDHDPLLRRVNVLLLPRGQSRLTPLRYRPKRIPRIAIEQSKVMS
jgi:hypothetical protein